MNSSIYAFICTRSKKLSNTTEKLVSYLSRAKVEVKLLVGANSIFEGYQKAFDKVNPNPNDIIIMCHDDVEIVSTSEHFSSVLTRELLLQKDVGFIGPAGTTELSNNAVWWDQEQWKLNKHSGMVFHGNSLTDCNTTFYGPYRRVVVLDGLFLAAKASTIKDIGLDKPEEFEGNWDFYDITYTMRAHEKGYHNKAAPILIIHNSSGELAGRDSWHKNRQAFIDKYKFEFPFIV